MTLSDWGDSQVPNGAGVIDDRFLDVGTAFAKNFSDGHEIGACFSAIIDGELVVDIRGGWRERHQETPWAEDTIACIYSSGKAVLALLIARAVSEGRLEYDAPVARAWPEFATNGKEAITLAQVMSHQDGLVAFPEETPPETYLDWAAACAGIENMAPLWPPGTANGYHPQTFGFIAGEILRRATGKTVGELLAGVGAAEDLQVFCGLTPEQMARVAQMQKPPRPPDLGDINEFKKLAFLSRSSAPARAGKEEWMAAQIPASNMHADARSLARLLWPLANEGRNAAGDLYVDPGVVEAMLAERARGDDLVLPFHLSWSAGLMRNINRHFGPNENAFGHAGFGGSCIVIDPENRLVAAYVMNKMSPHLVGDPRPLALLAALYAVL